MKTNHIQTIFKHINNIISKANSYRNVNFADRTNEGYKCDRDIRYILMAYLIDLKNETDHNTKMTAATFWKNGSRVLKDYKAEIAIHNYIVNYIINNVLHLKQTDPLAIELTRLKDMLIDTIENGINEKTEILANVYRSQKCQRNWNLEKTIDRETVEWLLEVGYTAPTKHNLDTFEIVAVTNRDLINQISKAAVNPDNFNYFLPEEIRYGSRVQNPQTDSNVLFCFFIKKNEHNSIERKKRELSPPVPSDYWLQCVNLEIGLAASAMAISANQVGLRTGFCRCYDPTKMPVELTEEMGLSAADFVIFLGVGYPNDTLSHEQHVDGNVSSSHGKLKKNRIII